MDIKALEDQLSKFIYELETEDRLVRVGLKDKAETEKIYKKHKELFTEETLDKVETERRRTPTSLKLRGASKETKTKDILERIYFTLAGSFIGLATAA